MQSRRKEIILLVLAVAALVVALYTFVGKRSPAPEPESTAAAPAEAAGKEVARAADEEGPTEVTEEPGATGEDRNPFSAPGTAAGGERATEASAPGVDSGFPDAPQAPPAEGATSQPAAPSEPGDTGLRLVGITTGPPAIAVIRHGDQRYFARVGAKVGESYRVQAIRGEQEVVLVSQQGTLVLTTRPGKSS